MNKFRSGAWAGLLATGPMTLGFFAFQDSMPKSERSPLPPATLTKQIIGSNNPDITMASHFGYGLATGVLYSLFTKRDTAHPLLRGTTFGLGVWAASYLGWIPMFGLRARAPNLTPERNAMMIVSHAIWGLALGMADYHLQKSGNEMLKGNRKAPEGE